MCMIFGVCFSSRNVNHGAHVGSPWITVSQHLFLEDASDMCIWTAGAQL